ncbi:Squalene/phytoene synthase [Palleronia marisminoris]|uniref:Squalene/phytoene synthase n=1 Tax=Palleronia marisminoris TaxID=315423 RepID=A0A1Y5TFV8_9RHOB|nr:squalene/phytoene synthase family protein [Palleronia marisminoris]SFH37936.1 Squalene/phytoene synthase [Palleronia marisminoris]SLN62910.1 Squalene/phytoene synthase [Palleronia marisminoris]
MSVNACAEIVRNGDPDRFLAAMAAPPAARRALFPIYALNVEAARAPWVTAEPMIAEIRLQWWRDALDEIAEGKTPRRHEVVTPLAEIVDAEGAHILDRAVAARRWEIAREPFVGTGQLLGHMDDLAGSLMWAAARCLGASDEAQVRGVGVAGGLAGWLTAVPELEARGLAPLPDPSDDGIRALAEEGLSRLGSVSRAARPAALAAWEARPVLAAARSDPARVREGRLLRAPAIRRLRLMRMASLGR